MKFLTDDQLHTVMEVLDAAVCVVNGGAPGVGEAVSIICELNVDLLRGVAKAATDEWHAREFDKNGSPDYEDLE